MIKTDRFIVKKAKPGVAAQAPLFEALTLAQIPATQQALSQIQSLNHSCKRTNAKDPTQNKDAVSSEETKIETESLLRALAESIRAWRQHLPFHVQPSLLAIVHGGTPIDVESIAFTAPNLVRVSGLCLGNRCRIIAPAAEMHFICVPKSCCPASALEAIEFDLPYDRFSA